MSTGPSRPRFGHRRRLGLHHRLFAWFGVSILLTLIAAVVVGVIFIGHPSREHRGYFGISASRADDFVAARFAEVWSEPLRRSELARSMSDDLGLGVELYDAGGALIERRGGPCPKLWLSADVEQGGARLGRVGLCVPRRERPPWGFLAALAAAALTLWLASGALARHLARPLRELARVTSEIGAGKLSSRARLDGRHPGEVGALAHSINDMAMRIERQMGDQRELLAAVSHEVRTPLGHLAVLTELLRQRGAPADLLIDVEREISEIDRLVDELLASSRLEFSALSPQVLDAAAVARRAAERARLEPSLLALEVEDTRLEADPTLLARALSNLLDNAQRHGNGVVRLAVSAGPGGDSISFAVDDAGEGFQAADLERAFDSFYRGGAAQGAQSSLGLGLALVRRIARAHGGDAWAENLPRGARVALWVPRVPRKRSEPSVA